MSNRESSPPVCAKTGEFFCRCEACMEKIDEDVEHLRDPKRPEPVVVGPGLSTIFRREMSKLYGTGSSNIGIPSPNVSVAKTTQTSDYEGDGELTPGGTPDMIVVKGRRPTKPEEDYEGSDYDYVPSSLGSYATVERLSPEGRGTDYSEAAMKSQRRKENIVEKSRKSGGLKKAAEDRDGKGKGAA